MEEKNNISCRKVAAVIEKFAFYNKWKFDTHEAISNKDYWYYTLIIINFSA